MCITRIALKFFNYKVQVKKINDFGKSSFPKSNTLTDSNFVLRWLYYIFLEDLPNRSVTLRTIAP